LRFIPQSLHGVADYLVGIGMILLAFLSGAEGPIVWIFLLLGIFAIVYSLVTDYPLGWKPLLTMPTHLAVDAGFAVVMLALPLIFSMPVLLVWVSLGIGVAAAFLVATTRMK
jgi:hypothetical protein